MLSGSGRYVIAFNGEIYNHLELRREVEDSLSSAKEANAAANRPAIAWRGHSDTETLLATIEKCGVEEALRRTVGMFAFALWDRSTQKLTLARDRLGEKPLYYGCVRGAFVFGSELKALRAYPGFENRIERRALALYMRHNYVPAPWSIYEGIRKLPPGCYIEVDAGKMREGGPRSAADCQVRTYWSALDVAERGLQSPFLADRQETSEEVERLLRQSIAGQMMADVPVGAFLSGGIDSSAVVALMQSLSSRPVKTFTIGFHEGEYNEADHAKAVAQHLHTDHTELYVTPKQAIDVIPMLPNLYDEPFADSSQIPTFLVSRLARQHVTVALSGDGGDELFGGYNRYFLAMRVWRKLRSLPAALRHFSGEAITALPPATWNRIFALLRPLVSRRSSVSNPGDKLHKLAHILSTRQPEDFYLQLVSHWDDPKSVVLNAEEPATALNRNTDWLGCEDFEHRMMYLDTITYLPDDILVKVDRAAMAVSLETRVPMLDHRVVEFAWRLPLSMKISRGQGKCVLRDVLYRYVPRELVERPKMGFGVPLDHWLRGPLRDWAEDLLDAHRLRREGFFEPSPIRQKWEEHISGRRNWQYPLWDVLMFQAWRMNADAGRDA